MVVAPSIMTGAISLCAYLLKEKHEDRKKKTNSEVLLLRIVLRNFYKDLEDRGMDAEDFADFEILYQEYASRGGNGEIKRLYEELKRKEIKEC